MLIKEYRIALPLSVEEYRIAQLYMIQKKSRDESQGEGNGVEILVNEPYEEGPGGSGQYTRKVYHIGTHIPGWFRSILPKAALRVEEEAWNAYPYTRTRYTCPFIEKFYLEIETKYCADGGKQDNVFNLSGAEKRNRIVDVIDVVKDDLPAHDYKLEEDPALYKSVKTGRGPLGTDWKQKCQDSQTQDIMCSYKLCKVEFRYWGMQNKIEKFIHDVALRKTMLQAHRQAWCWQDEWEGLQIDDIRRLEKETQLALAHKMHRQDSSNSMDSTVSERDEEMKPAPPQASLRTTDGDFQPPAEDSTLQATETSRSAPQNRSANGCESRNFFEWRFQSIMRDSENSSSDEEFFDAQDVLDETLLTKWSSEEMVAMEMVAMPPETPDKPQEKDDLIEMQEGTKEHAGIPSPQQEEPHSVQRLPTSLQSSSQAASSAPCNLLILVLHGGSILDQGSSIFGSKQSDISTFTSTFESVIKSHFPSMAGQVSIQLVTCPRACVEALSMLTSVSPFSTEAASPHSKGRLLSKEHLPIGAVPLLSAASADFPEHVAAVIARANQVYQDFLGSPEGAGFCGQVCLIGDCVGGILGYEALCLTQQYGSGASEDHSPCSPHTPGTAHAMDSPYTPGTAHAMDSPYTPGPGSAHRMDMDTGGLGDHSPCSPYTPGTAHAMDSPYTPGPGSAHRMDMDTEGSSLLEDSLGDSDRGADGEVSSPSSSFKGRFPSIPSGQDSDSPRRRFHLSYDSPDIPAPGDQPTKFEFEVGDFFLFGCPLSLILIMRQLIAGSDKKVCPAQPACTQVYNMFHPTDPLAARLEPLIQDQFSHIAPVSVSRYHKFPLGDGSTNLLVDAVQSHPSLFMSTLPLQPEERRPSEASVSSQTSQSSGQGDAIHYLASVTNRWWGAKRIDYALYCPEALTDLLFLSSLVTNRWWGAKRIDYALYCPEALTAFPSMTLPYLFHASYWESADVIAFILRQVVRVENVSIHIGDGKEMALFSPTQPRERWLKRRTAVKIKNMTANHRAADIVTLQNTGQSLTARFMYGPLDMVALTGEKVDVYIMLKPPAGEWVHFDTALTNNHGRINYAVPKERLLGCGIYPVKMIVRGDHTSADSFLTVILPKTECVVFSIDGSFTASVSIMGKDPKVRAGAVDVVRHWQELGYLIVYVTGRPDMQKHQVVSWLAQHNFPHGVVSFCDGLSHDPLRQKANYLRNLVQEVEIVVHAAYGSVKDIPVYTSLGLDSSRLFIVGRPNKKNQNQAQFINEGYAVHLSHLLHQPASQPAKGGAYMVLHKGCFRCVYCVLTVVCLLLQFINEGYAVHLSHLLHQPASQPAKGGAYMVLHKGCFGLPGQAKGMIRPMAGRQATISPGSAQAAPSSQ
ncbi:membrane-associated phosphatidylinositol transfer protein 1-like [Branchiostoma lanceolatum]|uniref:membrane-associated phosphatidylinositol transfer protein 1-like n=1 Tax=Branchiostoma lanceolatum TaxID=7740 RepID=UPI0034541209